MIVIYRRKSGSNVITTWKTVTDIATMCNTLMSHRIVSQMEDTLQPFIALNLNTVRPVMAVNREQQWDDFYAISIETPEYCILHAADRELGILLLTPALRAKFSMYQMQKLIAHNWLQSIGKDFYALQPIARDWLEDNP